MLFKPQPIHGVLPVMAAIKEFGARYSNWNKVLNVANQCQMAQAGITILTDAFGNQMQVSQDQLQSLQQGQPQGLLPANTPAAKVAETTESIQAVKAEINKTQGRAQAKIEQSIRADMQAGFDELKALIAGNQAPPEDAA